MKKKVVILFILIYGINNLFGQKPINSENSYITIGLISPIFSYSPKWRFGYYKYINEKLIIGGKIGIGTFGTSINFAADANWIEKDYYSFEISPELIYFFNSNRKTKRFISTEIFYIYHKDKLKNRVYKNDNDSQFYNYDIADYKRNKFGINFNYGMIINFSNKIGIIPKIGIGMKMRNVNFSNVINPIENINYEEPDTFFPTANDYLTIEGFHANINFNFDIQLFYKFK